jgi:hypothetical protein
MIEAEATALHANEARQVANMRGACGLIRGLIAELARAGRLDALIWRESVPRAHARAERSRRDGGEASLAHASQDAEDPLF